MKVALAATAASPVMSVKAPTMAAPKIRGMDIPFLLISFPRFTNGAGLEAAVVPAGPMRANNADALAPALRAGLGLAVQPDFMVWEDLKAGRLERVLPDWTLPPIALHLVMPPGEPRPARVTALIGFLAQALTAAPWASPHEG